MNKGKEKAPEERICKSEQHVWIWTVEEEYKRATLLKEEEKNMLLFLEGKEIREEKDKVQKANPNKFDLVENMAHLSYLNEPSILHNLQQRYQSDLQYTYSGLFLVAVNPYKDVGVYTKESISQYSSVHKREDAPPHIYAVASEAYHLMRNTKKPQTILITGESGAGKTENTKHAITFLTKISENISQKLGLLEEQLLWTNPLLEAFGNAQTTRNDNSSRFGKFIKIEFGADGEIVGALIERYLLESSRVTSPPADERNYHIFHSLIEQADDSLLSSLHLTRNKEYKIISKVKGKTIPFHSVQEALNILNVSETEQTKILQILSAIIHLGEISFHENKEVTLPDTQRDALTISSSFLGVDEHALLSSLLHPKIRAGHEMVTHGRTAQQANFTVTSLCKVIYERLFDWIILLINRALKPSQPSQSYIGVLDIAGFEILKKNGFEQLCINYTNEKLQQFFNHRMFILEQETYLKEGLEWNMIDFGFDLQPTIDLIDSQGTGLFSLLDEECIVPGGSDDRLLSKITKTWMGTKKFSSPRFKDGFVVGHYAGEVQYNEPGWILKNKDPLDEAIAALVLGPRSNVPNVHNAQISATRFRTVAQKHKQQLSNLLDMLQGTHPHFVRCILPNAEKRPNLFISSKVLHQLRCNGVLEGVRISRQGFPSRLPFNEFVSRYSLLPKNNKNFLSTQQGVLELLKELEVPHSLFRLGTSLLFLRQGVLADLEENRNTKISGLVNELQRRLKGLLHANREKLQKIRDASIALLQKNIKTHAEVRQWSWWKLCMKVRPLLEIRKSEDEIRERDRTISLQKEELLNLLEKTKELETAHVDAESNLLTALSQIKELEAAWTSQRLRTEKEHEELAKELAGAQKASAKAVQTIEAQKKEIQLAAERTERARKAAADEGSNKLLLEISSLKQLLVMEQEKRKEQEEAANRLTEQLDATEHQKSIFLLERNALEGKVKKLLTETEELQREVAESDSLKRKTESALQAAHTEIKRTASALKFEKEKHEKLDEAFKRVTTTATPPPQTRAPDNSQELKELKKALAHEKEESANIQEEYEQLRREYFELVDEKLGNMLETQKELSSEINRLRSLNIHLQQQLAQKEIKIKETQSALEETQKQKAHEQEKRKSLELAAATKRSLELELQRTIARLSKEKELLSEDLSNSSKYLETHSSHTSEIVAALEQTISSVSSISKEVEELSVYVHSSSSVLSLYHKELKQMRISLLLSEKERDKAMDLLKKEKTKEKERDAYIDWLSKQVEALTEDKVHLLKETENELLTQREKIEETEKLWDTAKREFEKKTRNLLKEKKDLERVAASVPRLHSEISSLNARIHQINEELEVSLEKADKHLTDAQETILRGERAVARAKEEAAIAKREAQHFKKEKQRVEAALLSAKEKEEKRRTEVHEVEEKARDTEAQKKALLLEINSLSLEIHALRVSSPVPK
ncbi:myosin heavy chain 9/10/11/14 [Nematocida sp. LUAm3]|nr:myosin heavy chain 9/10/11/14 [Nematocida sp. LUAm3]KAI5175571.1 myosin heavy chain 9/10/11/14 [Nematocida sp. LUAm2]KAI5178399.1 myosin heavy chain 9/10/11/14 [Nematocida sp. LUAm1]